MVDQTKQKYDEQIIRNVMGKRVYYVFCLFFQKKEVMLVYKWSRI